MAKKEERLQEILDSKEKQLHIINESLTQPLFMLEVEEGFKYKFISVSKSFLKVLGIKEHDVIGKYVNEFIPEPSLTLVLKKYKEAIQNKTSVQWEETTPYKTGFKTAIVTINPLLNSEDDCTHLVGLVYDITELKKSEKLVLQSKEEIENIIDNIGDPIFVKDNQSRLLHVNDAFCRMFDLPRKSIIGKTLGEDVAPEEMEEFLKIDQAVLSTGIENINEETLTIRGGETKVILTKKTRFIDDSGNKFLIGIIRDITERKVVEQQMKKANEFYEGLLSTMAEGLVVIDLNREVTKVNNAFCEMTGFTKEEIIGTKAPFPYWPPEKYEEYKQNFSKATKGVEYRYNLTLIKKNGERFPVSLYAKPLKSKEGELLAIFATIQDLTEQKENEAKLQEAVDFSQGLIDSMHEGLVVFNMQTKIISVNPYFCDLTGFSQDELIGKVCPYPFSPPEDEEGSKARHKMLSQGEDLGEFHTVYMKKDGTRFNVHVQVSELMNSEGEEIAYFGTIQDVTERIKSQIKLKLAKEFSDKLIMSMQEGLIIVDTLGKIILVNESTCKILGYSKDELIGMELPYPFAKMEDFEKINKTNEKVAKGEAPSFQFEFIRKNGEVFLASFLTGNIKNDDGEVIALFGTMKDISEENKAKIALLESARKSNQKKKVILELAGLVGKNFQHTLKTITKLAAKTLATDRVSIWSFNDDKTEIRCQKLYSISNDSFETGHILKYDDNPNYFVELEKRKTITVEDAQNNSITKKFSSEYLEKYNIVSLMDVFIPSTDGYYGIICFEQTEELKEWTAEEQEFATSIANIVSLMVESNERKAAEEKTELANKKLVEANEQLMHFRNQLEQENVYLRNELDLVFNYEEMVYGSASFSNVLTEVEKVAPTNATVLLLGESGTGKELLARAIHNISLRNNKPLIKVNCSAIPRELIESELFGHKKGSFTGAFSDKVGKFELANEGTLFLDEIGELPLDMQPKILRFLQEGEIEVIGGAGAKKLNVRVIAATNRKLKEEVENKRFREDLYFRLNVFPISIPPLRERKDDIPLLVEHFVDKFNKAYDKNIKYVPDEAMSKMLVYKWPGNVRELENLIERASILSNTDTLAIPGFETSYQKSKQKLITERDLTLNSVLRSHIIQVLEQCEWKINGEDGASSVLGLKPSTLRDKMAKLNIKRPKANNGIS